MSVRQEVSETGTQPRRRTLRVFLFAAAPLAIAVAAAGGMMAANIAPTPVAKSQEPVDSSAREVSFVAQTETPSQMSNVLAAVVAPAAADDTDLTDAAPQIEVSLAPEPEPEPEVALSNPVRSNSSSGSSSNSNSGDAAPAASTQKAPSQEKSADKAPAKKESSEKAPAKKEPTKEAPAKKAPISSEAYCKSPQSPYSAGGSVKGLLTAANKERARIGLGSLSWSGSLASAATSWSKSMAAKDTQSDGSALSHNPNRPGGENVAVSGSSGGMSVGTAANKAHNGWMYSGGHCRNVMHPSYSSMGAGAAATADGKAVYTTANYR